MTQRNFETLEVGRYYKSNCGAIEKISGCFGSILYKGVLGSEYNPDGVYLDADNDNHNLIEKVDIVPCHLEGQSLCNKCYGSGYMRSTPNPTTEEKSAVEVENISEFTVTVNGKNIPPTKQKPRKFKVGDRVIAKTNYDQSNFFGKVIGYTENGNVIIINDCGHTMNWSEGWVKLQEPPIKLFVGAICETEIGDKITIIGQSGQRYFGSNNQDYPPNGIAIDYCMYTGNIRKVLNPQEII